MLRITVSSGGPSAVNYFRDALSRQDYYAEQSKVLGQWHGRTADRLGLSGPVSEHDFEQLVNNRNPHTGEKITPRDAANRRAGYDFTFNAPKTVSILAAITKDEAIHEAHRTAVERAMREVEDNMQLQVGQGKQKRYETSGNLVYAAFEHDVTRPVEHETEAGKQFVPDPHLHVHCFVMNTTWNEDKDRYQAIEIGNIKKNAPYYEALYHCHLAHELQRAGYAIERTKNSFEIAGIERETIEKYSNRTLEIEKTAREKGLDWAEDKAELGAKTRHNKNRSVSEQAMHRHWSDRLTLRERFALHSAKGAKEAARGLAVEKENGGVSPGMAIDLALQHYMERKSAVTEKQVLGYALKLGVDRFTPEQIQAELDGRKGKDVFSGQKNSDTYITTREALTAEDRMKDFAVSTRARFCGINPDYVSQKEYLNAGQRGAIDHALTSPDQVILISGGAGVGKTTLMKEVKAGVEASGKQLFAFAPSADASRGVLRSKDFKDADTIKKLLDDTRLQDRLKGQVILIDEAGMVGNQTMNGIFEIAKKQEARVILSGDWKQHNSVEAGDALRLLEQDTELPVARVTEIVRQKDKRGYRQAVEQLSKGDTERGFETLDRLDSIIEIADQGERHERIANDYLRSIQAPPIRQRGGKVKERTAIVVSPTHAEGRAITAAIRGKLKAEGLVGQEERTFEVLRSLSYTDAEKQDHVNYHPGLEVQFHKTHQSFKAGQAYRVARIGKDGQVLMQGADQDTLIPLPFDRSQAYQVCRKETIALAQGDVIRVTGNGKSADGKALNNGENYTIEAFTKDGDLQLTGGKVLGQDYRNFTLGYYRTSHAAQGKDADDVLIAQSSTSFPASNEKQFYVSVSRGVERCLVYTDDKQALKWAANQQADRMSAAEVAETSQDRSLWLDSRNAFRRMQVAEYEKDIERYRRQKLQSQSQPSKERTYEPDHAILPSRSEPDFQIDL